jgi:two-component system, NtrC family, sensor kinase
MKRRSKVSGKPAKAQGRNAARPKRRTAQHEPTVAFAAGELGESPGTIRELNEAREQLQAISEVLRALGSSHGQLEPIFQSMLKNATRLCEAKFGALYLRLSQEPCLGVNVKSKRPAGRVSSQALVSLEMCAE